MSPSKTKWHHTKDGEGRELPIGASRFEACCDCGLVHRHTYAVEPVKGLKNRGKVVEYVTRDNRKTAKLRQKMTRDDEIIRLDESNAYIIIRRIHQNKARKPIKLNIEPCEPFTEGTREL